MLLGQKKQMCVKNLPRVITWQCTRQKITIQTGKTRTQSIRSYKFSHIDSRAATKMDLGRFSMFGETQAPTHKGGPRARECRTAAQHYLACHREPFCAVWRHLIQSLLDA